ncbi:activator of HSP90 ATPase [Mameliella alba]|uniref:Activator of Hsp90 ATPase 1 family protein n=1 Tax=Mameliella alba TaxID=561184 RepID=A0A0B3RTZ2_9RHOB|nr:MULTISPECIES: SRPBCC family protein [Mameliella]MBV6637874.1 SRPBCC family protein [Mameliella sp.]MCR9274241.1 SRPBCC family protein [Paracoccaceae bacterium]ODM50391.1 polyketide cyclase [Ruegeria sp. PBVC088]KHQ51537.1 Activator of Hsp90 ATPase 1 family protein [Mameliella alba]MDD9733846.1 SRPBCC family protein [Mameliella sp. AT18]
MPDLDPDLDLRLERMMDVPPATLWRCWTEPELLMQWFCPRPWHVTEAVIDLRPGGRFFTRMAGPLPDGSQADMPNEGCFLAVDPERRLVFTDALQAGWRPAAQPFMTAIVTFEPRDGGTFYTATALHNDTAARDKHEEMGFSKGWNTAADQMLDIARSL